MHYRYTAVGATICCLRTRRAGEKHLKVRFDPTGSRYGTSFGHGNWERRGREHPVPPTANVVSSSPDSGSIEVRPHHPDAHRNTARSIAGQWQVSQRAHDGNTRSAVLYRSLFNVFPDALTSSDTDSDHGPGYIAAQIAHNDWKGGGSIRPHVGDASWAS
jgi:hypothetical protein